MTQPPEYADGVLNLYKINQDTSTDYPIDVLVDEKIKIWYREISIYDRVRYEFDQGGKEITMKIRIPRYKEIDSKSVCVIDGRQHRVYNAAHIVDKNGFLETELTLIAPEKEFEIK